MQVLRINWQHKGTAPVAFRDIDDVLKVALDKKGYNGGTYYVVPGGFALVTRLEQFDKSGVSKPAPIRWAIGPDDRPDPFSFQWFVQALFLGNAGERYRVFVFVVTNAPFSQTGSTRFDPLWNQVGKNILSKAIADTVVPPDYACTALVYEFECRALTDVRVVIPGSLTATDHLRQSGLWDLLVGN